MSPLARAGPSAFRAALKRSPTQVRTLYTTREHVAHSVSYLFGAPFLVGVPDTRDQCLIPHPLRQNFPFSYANKRKFAVKYVGAVGACFLLPFVAAGYQL